MSTHSKTVEKEIRGEWDGLKLVLFCRAEVKAEVEKMEPFQPDNTSSQVSLLDIDDIMQDHPSYDFHMTEESRKLFISKYGPSVEDRLEILCQPEIDELYTDIERGLNDD